MQKIIYTNDVKETLADLIGQMAPASVHLITDTNVGRAVVPLIADPSWHIIEIQPGDEAKNLDSLASVWQQLVDQGATRRSAVINVGGGVVTDLGGFAAATFKRGVRFINVPTTLLSAVDAAVGGKTGINFAGLKNEIGAFAPADAVVISTRFFATLPAEELLSGYAEMLKHGLLDSPEAYAELLGYPILEADLDAMLPLLERSVKVKERIVTEDPLEKGLRRALNLGHTAGHAFEGLALRRGRHLPHGHAVAFGMIVELVLAHMREGFPSAELHRLAAYLKEQGYGNPGIECKDYAELLEFMHHDKKNDSPDSINFTLLAAPGRPLTDRTASAAEIETALDIFRDLIG